MRTKTLILAVLLFGCGSESTQVDPVKRTDVEQGINLDAGLNLVDSLINSKFDTGQAKADSLKPDVYQKPDASIKPDISIEQDAQAQDALVVPDVQVIPDVQIEPDVTNPKQDSYVEPQPDTIKPPNCAGPCVDWQGNSGCKQLNIAYGNCACVVCSNGNTCQKLTESNTWHCACDPVGYPPIICELETMCNPTLKKCVCRKTPNEPCNGGYCDPQCYYEILYGYLYRQCPEGTVYRQGRCDKRTVP